jgi:hypothetical protein
MEAKILSLQPEYENDESKIVGETDAIHPDVGVEVRQKGASIESSSGLVGEQKFVTKSNTIGYPMEVHRGNEDSVDYHILKNEKALQLVTQPECVFRSMAFPFPYPRRIPQFLFFQIEIDVRKALIASHYFQRQLYAFSQGPQKERGADTKAITTKSEKIRSHYMLPGAAAPDDSNAT